MANAKVVHVRHFFVLVIAKHQYGMKVLKSVWKAETLTIHVLMILNVNGMVVRNRNAIIIMINGLVVDVEHHRLPLKFLAHNTTVFNWVCSILFLSLFFRVNFCFVFVFFVVYILGENLLI